MDRQKRVVAGRKIAHRLFRSPAPETAPMPAKDDGYVDDDILSRLLARLRLAAGLGVRRRQRAAAVLGPLRRLGRRLAVPQTPRSGSDTGAGALRSDRSGGAYSATPRSGGSGGSARKGRRAPKAGAATPGGRGRRAARRAGATRSTARAATTATRAAAAAAATARGRSASTASTATAAAATAAARSGSTRSTARTRATRTAAARAAATARTTARNRTTGTTEARRTRRMVGSPSRRTARSGAARRTARVPTPRVPTGLLGWRQEERRVHREPAAVGDGRERHQVLGGDGRQVRVVVQV